MCANITDSRGFGQKDDIVRFNEDVRIKGLNFTTMQAMLSFSSKAVLSNGQLAKRYIQPIFDEDKGEAIVSLKMVEYSKTTSIFEKLFREQ